MDRSPVGWNGLLSRSLFSRTLDQWPEKLHRFHPRRHRSKTRRSRAPEERVIPGTSTEIKSDGKFWLEHLDGRNILDRRNVSRFGGRPGDQAFTRFRV